MSIKNQLVRLAEKITGRKCCRCAHNCNGVCMHPYEKAFSKCWQSITRPGFVRSESVDYLEVGKAMAEGFREGMGREMTEEERHQFEKIKDALHEASETARDGGLLGIDPRKAVPEYLDDRTESGLLEED